MYYYVSQLVEYLLESKLAPNWTIAEFLCWLIASIESQPNIYKRNASVCLVSVEINLWKLKDYDVNFIPK